MATYSCWCNRCMVPLGKRSWTGAVLDGSGARTWLKGAAQERMQLISQLARKEKRDDNFGMRDEDWDVYKTINKEGGNSDSDEEQKLLELEEVLRHHDPEFEKPTGPGASGSGGSCINSAANTGETHHLPVGIERLRIAEILFQPSMVGSGEAGLAETIEFLLGGYPADVQSELLSNIFLTGGCAAFPSFDDHLKRELQEMRPFKSTFIITGAAHPSLETWHGAQAFAISPHLQEFLVTRQEYEEKGGEYFKQHAASNMYFPSHIPLPLEEIVPQPIDVEDVEIQTF